MMSTLKNLREKIEEKKQKKETSSSKERETVDMDQVENIVNRMKKKYVEQGIELEQAGGKLGELRGIIAEGETAKIDVQKVEDLQEFQNPTVKQIGNIYLLLRVVFDPVSNLIKKFPIASDIRFYLYSANMRYSLSQWIAVSIVSSFLGAVFIFVLFFALTFIVAFNPLIAAGMALVFGWLILFVLLFLPKSKATARGEQVSAELPFALRHMATELKAGIGLYKTIQTIASSDYGVLSEEFSRAISEIEEGTDTKDALRHFALRTQSKALRSALFHIIRAMKTGGNLSEIMNTIAEDVSFDARNKIRDFAEKMNFFGVIYIFIAIVAPVFITIFGAVTNAPISVATFAIAPLAIAGILIPGMAMVLGFLIFYLKSIQPRV